METGNKTGNEDAERGGTEGGEGHRREREGVQREGWGEAKRAREEEREHTDTPLSPTSL